MAKKQCSKGQRDMTVNLRHTATPDAEQRLTRAMSILLNAAARDASQSKDNINAQEEESPCETPAEDTLTAGDGECKDGNKRSLQN